MTQITSRHDDLMTVRRRASAVLAEMGLVPEAVNAVRKSRKTAERNAAEWTGNFAKTGDDAEAFVVEFEDRFLVVFRSIR